MPREVVRVVTPGTVVEPTLLDEKRNNYLAALVVEGNKAGIAHVDITTGEFATTQIFDDNVWQAVGQELERFQPAEVLIGDEGQGTGDASFLSSTYHLSPYDDWRFELGNARQALLDHFGVASLAGFGCEGFPLAVRAAGAIVWLGQRLSAGGAGCHCDRYGRAVASSVAQPAVA